MSTHDEDEPLDYSWQLPALQEGWREGTVVDAIVKAKDGSPLVSSKGDRMVRLDFKLEPEGRTSAYIMLTGGGAETGQVQLGALGFANGEPLSVAKFKGRSAMLLCKIEEFPEGSGNRKLGVDSFNKDHRGGMKPLPAEIRAEREAARLKAIQEAAESTPF